MALQSWYVTTRDMPGHHDGVVKYHDCHKCWAPEAWVVSPTGSPASAGVLIPPLRTARLMCVPEATSGGAESSRHREWWWSGGGGVPGELPASQHARGPPGGCSTQHTAHSAQRAAYSARTARESSILQWPPEESRLDRSFEEGPRRHSVRKLWCLVSGFAEHSSP